MALKPVLASSNQAAKLRLTGRNASCLLSVSHNRDPRALVLFKLYLRLAVFKSSSYTRHAEYPRNIANSCVTVTVTRTRTRKEMPEYGTGDVP